MGGTIPPLKCGRNIFSQLEEFGLLAQIEEEVSLMRLWCPAVNDNGIGLVVSFERTTRVTVSVCRLVVLELIATCDESARLYYETQRKWRRSRQPERLAQPLCRLQKSLAELARVGA